MDEDERGSVWRDLVDDVGHDEGLASCGSASEAHGFYRPVSFIVPQMSDASWDCSDLVTLRLERRVHSRFEERISRRGSARWRRRFFFNGDHFVKSNKCPIFYFSGGKWRFLVVGCLVRRMTPCAAGGDARRVALGVASGYVLGT